MQALFKAVYLDRTDEGETVIVGIVPQPVAPHSYPGCAHVGATALRRYSPRFSMRCLVLPRPSVAPSRSITATRELRRRTVPGYLGPRREPLGDGRALPVPQIACRMCASRNRQAPGTAQTVVLQSRYTHR